MRWLYKFPLRLRSLFRKHQADHDLSAELQFHMQQQIDQNLARGMPPEEARSAALREFGGVEQVKEECREMREVSYIENLAQDLRFGLRQLRRAPGFTAVAVLTLALGIGANTAVFSVVDGVILRSLPFPEAGRLVAINNDYPQGAFVAMHSNLRTMDLATYEDAELNLTGMGEPERLYGDSVSAEFFSVLGARPALGTGFQRDQDQPGKDNVVILSHSLWQNKFGSDPDIVGRTIQLEGVTRQVVGVMPASFHFPSPKVQVWMPMHLDPRDVGIYWGNFNPVLGRLRPDATLDQARAEAGLFIPRIRTMFPWKMPANLWPVINVTSLRDSLVGDVRSRLLLLLGAIGLVLLIACANVANLLLARAATRQKEIAVRSALGASQGRIFRQLLTESVVLAVCGGALGLLLAVKGVDWLEKTLPADTPRLDAVAIDWRVLLFTGAIAVLTGVIFGLAPALHSSAPDLTESLRGRGKGTGVAQTRRMRNSFAVSEIALACVLVIAAGLTVKSLWQLLHVDPGFRAESIVTARISPSESFCIDFARCTSFYNTLLDRLKGLPGVSNTALVNVLPLNGREADVPIKAENYIVPPGGANPMLWENISSPGYLGLMGIRLLRGRSFTDADGAPNAQPVVLVSQSAARRLWPGQDPIGQHIKPAWLPQWRTVVGLVGDVHEDQLNNRLPDYMIGEVYLPFGPGANLQPAHPPAQMTLLVRTSNSRLDVAGVLQPLIAELTKEVPVTEIRTLPGIVSDSVSAPRSTMSLFAAFAGLALFLGGIGIYGVVSYSTAQRTAEIGLRIALGAQPNDVLRMVLRQGAALALAGVIIGLIAALALTRLLAGLLFGVSVTDPLVFTSVSLLLTLVALAACYIPARRAMKVDPMVALRYE